MTKEADLAAQKPKRMIPSRNEKKKRIIFQTQKQMGRKNTAKHHARTLKTSTVQARAHSRKTIESKNVQRGTELQNVMRPESPSLGDANGAFHFTITHKTCLHKRTYIRRCDLTTNNRITLPPPAPSSLFLQPTHRRRYLCMKPRCRSPSIPNACMSHATQQLAPRERFRLRNNNQ